MSEENSKNKVVGRGRGRGKRTDGPMSRSKKMGEVHDVRRPKKEEDDSDTHNPQMKEGGQDFDSNETRSNSMLESDDTPSEPQGFCDLESEEILSITRLSVKPLQNNPEGNFTTSDPTRITVPERDSCPNATKVMEKKDNQEKEAPVHDDGQNNNLENTCKGEKIITGKDGSKYKVFSDGTRYRLKEDGSLGNQVFTLADIYKEHLEIVRQRAEFLNERTSKKTHDKHHGNVELLNGMAQEQVKSNLSPYAKEFIPRNLMNPNATDFVTQESTENENCDSNNAQAYPTLDPNINSSDSAALLADLEETINFCYCKLSETPAAYDELMGVVMPHFLKYLENPNMEFQIVQTIYSYAKNDLRFSYFAVRILVELINYLIESQDSMTLRSILLDMSRDEVLAAKENLGKPDVPFETSIRPVLSFISELYIQLILRNGQRFLPIGRAIVDILKKILFTPSITIKERMKTITYTLKLTGLSLDQDDRTLLDNFIQDLQNFLESESHNLDNPTNQSITDIINLRNSKWGTSSTDETTVPQTRAETFTETYELEPGYSINHDMAVFYGPDGQVLRYEEHLFLEVQMAEGMNHYHSDNQSEPSPHGMDEEMLHAYDEFLRTIPKTSNR